MAKGIYCIYQRECARCYLMRGAVKGHPLTSVLSLSLSLCGHVCRCLAMKELARPHPTDRTRDSTVIKEVAECITVRGKFSATGRPIDLMAIELAIKSIGLPVALNFPLTVIRSSASLTMVLSLVRSVGCHALPSSSSQQHIFFSCARSSIVRGCRGRLECFSGSGDEISV
jgi:hypothetical protein